MIKKDKDGVNLQLNNIEEVGTVKLSLSNLIGTFLVVFASWIALGEKLFHYANINAVKFNLHLISVSLIF